MFALPPRLSSQSFISKTGRRPPSSLLLLGSRSCCVLCFLLFIRVRFCEIMCDHTGLWDHRNTPPYGQNWLFYVQVALPRPFYLMNAHMFASLTLFGLLCCFALKIRWSSVHTVAPPPNSVSSHLNLGKSSILLRSLQGRHWRCW